MNVSPLIRLEVSIRSPTISSCSLSCSESDPLSTLVTKVFGLNLLWAAYAYGFYCNGFLSSTAGFFEDLDLLEPCLKLLNESLSLEFSSSSDSSSSISSYWWGKLLALALILSLLEREAWDEAPIC